jgi:riboflavin transporter FmnP
MKTLCRMAKTTLTSLARTGFGLGLGVMAAQLIFLLVGAVLFIPGYLMFLNSKKDKQVNTATQVTGIILMGIGVLIMGGVGFGFLMENIEGIFE